MLYERWQQVAQQNRNELALHDLASERHWTFRELAASTEQADPLADASWAFPQGSSADFIFTTLRAWRTGQVVCPLEIDQLLPAFDAQLPCDIVHLKTTSATTGAAQLIAFTALQLIADAEHVVQTMGLRPDWPNLGVISMAHSYGFSNLVLPLLLHGIPLILGRSPLPEAVRLAAAKAKFITLPSVPALWRAWHEARAIPPNVKLAASAGAPLPVALETEIFSATEIKVHTFYGSSECGAIAFDSSVIPRTDTACVGAPVRGVELSLAEDGCLDVRGASVAETYWPVRSARLGEGYFRTSDLGEIVGGQVFLRGRVSDQINVAGRKVLPETIERALASHPSVRECLVFGVPSETPPRGEEIVACIVSRETVSISTLQQFLTERLPSWQVPRAWQFVSSLEANQRGKLSRAQWRDKFLSGVKPR